MPTDRLIVVSTPTGEDNISRKRYLEIDMAQAELIVASNSSDPNDWGFDLDWRDSMWGTVDNAWDNYEPPEHIKDLA